MGVSLVCTPTSLHHCNQSSAISSVKQSCQQSAISYFTEFYRKKITPHTQIVSHCSVMHTTTVEFNTALLPAGATCCKKDPCGLTWQMHGCSRASAVRSSRCHLLDSLANECRPHQEGHLLWIVDLLVHLPEAKKLDVLWHIACQLAAVTDQRP